MPRGVLVVGGAGRLSTGELQRLVDILRQRVPEVRVVLERASTETLASVAGILAVRNQFERMILDMPKLSMARIKTESMKPRATAGKIKNLGSPKRARRYMIPVPRRGCS